MELKVACNCGQKYKFDVEPVGNQMPFAVNCPVCGVDGTGLANSQLAQLAPASVAVAAPPVTAAPAPALAKAPPPPTAPRPASYPTAAVPRPAPRVKMEYRLGKGIAGAVIGAVVGGGLMYGFSVMAGFRFPLLGCAIGFLTGFLARIMAKGTDNTLGGIAAGIALVATAGTLYLIYGEFLVISLISIAVSASVAFRTAS